METQAAPTPKPTREEQLAAIEVILRRRRQKRAGVALVVALALGTLGYGMVQVLLAPVGSPHGRHAATLYEDNGCLGQPAVVQYANHTWWTESLPSATRLPVKGTLVILHEYDSGYDIGAAPTARFEYGGHSVDLAGGWTGPAC